MTATERSPALPVNAPSAPSSTKLPVPSTSHWPYHHPKPVKRSSGMKKRLIERDFWVSRCRPEQWVWGPGLCLFDFWPDLCSKRDRGRQASSGSGATPGPVAAMNCAFAREFFLTGWSGWSGRMSIQLLVLILSRSSACYRAWPILQVVTNRAFHRKGANSARKRKDLIFR